MKWFGMIGYEKTVETVPGVYVEKIEEHPYCGDLIKNYRRMEQGVSINDNVSVNNEISIIADEVAYHSFHSIRYVTFMGSKWKVTTVDVQPPRLILSIGGVYNGEESR